MKSLLVRSSILMTLLVAVTTVPSSARAQGSDSSTVGLTMQPMLTNLQSVAAGRPHVTTISLGSTIAPVGATRSMALAPVNIPAQHLASGENVGKSRAMMGVGLAALVVGIIVGGDIGTIFMIGGGVVGLMGLYQYMR
jgi:hypothetical protein